MTFTCPDSFVIASGGGVDSRPIHMGAVSIMKATHDSDLTIGVPFDAPGGGTPGRGGR